MTKLRYSIAMIRTDPPRPKAGETVPVLHLRSEVSIDRLRELVLELLRLPSKRRWPWQNGPRYTEDEIRSAIRQATAHATSKIMTELMNKRERQSVGTTTGRDG